MKPGPRDKLPVMKRKGFQGRSLAKEMNEPIGQNEEDWVKRSRMFLTKYSIAR